MARWGPVPFWMKDKQKKAFINTRAETVDSTPMFGRSEKRASSLTVFAGRILSRSPSRACGSSPASRARRSSAAIIVTAANTLVAPLHDCMPVILLLESYDEWLDPQTDADRLRELLRPVDQAVLETYPVSRMVNSPENDWEECIEPLPDDPE